MSGEDYLIVVEKRGGLEGGVNVNKAVLRMTRGQLDKLDERLQIIQNLLQDIAEKEYEDGDYPGYKFFD